MGLAPTYLSDSLRHVADFPSRKRLRSASSADLAVPQTRFKQSVIERSVLRRQKPDQSSVRSDVISDTVDI